MRSRLWTMLALLASLSATTGCKTLSTPGGAGEGSFCRLYQRVPAEVDAREVLENEITYCVMCDPTCPDRVVEGWEKRRAG
jgi:hypothetical protein